MVFAYPQGGPRGRRMMSSPRRLATRAFQASPIQGVIDKGRLSDARRPSHAQSPPSLLMMTRNSSRHLFQQVGQVADLGED